MAVDCPICNKPVKPNLINNHIDSGCESFVLDPSSSANTTSSPPPSTPSHTNGAGNMLTQPKRSAASTFFQTPAAKRQATTNRVLTPNANGKAAGPLAPAAGKKRAFDDGPGQEMVARTDTDTCATTPSGEQPQQPQQPPAAQGVLDAPAPKRTKTARSAPLAERMRPQALDDVFGQDLVGPHGVLRSLIETDRVPSMILWGGSGTGKTTIARCIAHRAGSRFIELNATSTGVAEVKKMFLEAANDLALTGRKTIIFCDEIHRFTKAQQDVFLKPVEAGTITLVGATTENPSFRVGAALLSRCRTFTLQKLSAENIAAILRRAVAAECPGGPPPLLSDGANADHLLTYLAAFADGDARTALNLLELALSLAARPDTTMDDLKASLTKTLVYDRAGDQHYDTISAFHKAMGFGAEYKYPPNYRDGKVRQDYLPEGMQGRRFLEDRHLGTEVDPDLEMGDS
ncbi:ATPase WRNIP1 [Verticillium alfalfae VaMs.102]|uniref:ATPase WRNIP1 n=1 Tax=Verticillium alfalfae (strain VaMs.102 / ATCC MYA-4576 / FGSC 10136) TaxID=526221 RepID=C9SCJ0_VERA1|nr:ATPase WRNIP1 [Verticillium alfalfae VaMs.102]EEY16805.1 ATPase WRNIP1 [Verticillium alfalfae VaMs.102]